jgi:predicted nuclease with TOPRIM domain
MLGIKICPVCHEIFDQKEGQENLTCGHPQCVKEAKEFLEEYDELEKYKEEVQEDAEAHNQRLKNKLRIVYKQLSAARAHIQDVKKEIEATEKTLQS